MRASPAPPAAAIRAAGSGPAAPDGGRTAEALETLRRMVDIPSPSGREAELVGYLTGRMTALGFRTRIDGAGNVLGVIGASTGPTIMLLGHVDTVPEPVPVRERDGRLFARGAVDAKGPLAAMVHAAARAARHTPARFVVVGAVDEEGASAGANHLRDRHPRPDAVLIGEPSGVAGVTLGYRGVLRLEYRVTRPARHSSRPEANAVELAARLWAELRAELAARHPHGPHFGRADATLLALDGDTTAARAVFSCRLPPGFAVAELLNWLAARADGGELTVLEQVPAVRTTRRDPVVRALSRAVRHHVGEPTLKVKLGTSDMNVVVPGWRVPTAAYGPGDSGLDHTDDEHLDLGEYLMAIDVLATALPDLAASLTAPEREETVLKRPDEPEAHR